MSSIITCDRVQDHCIFFWATAFRCSTWRSVFGMERHSLRISDLGWSSQDLHVQYHDGWSCKRSLHLYSSHCVQAFNMMELHENWWESIWPGQYPVVHVRYRHCFSVEGNTASVVEMQRLSLRISDLKRSSQNQHGQYHNVWSCKRSLHLYSSHCVQAFNMMELHENWWKSIWPGRYPVVHVRYRHCFSGERVHPVWSRLKGFHFESQI